MTLFLALLRQTIRAAFGQGGGAFTGLLFYFSVVATLPFAVGPDPATLSRIAPAMLWLGALLATLFGLDRLFQDDRDDGGLDLLILSGLPLSLVVLAKSLGHLVATGVPLLVGAPLFGLMLGLDAGAIGWNVAALALGLPALTFIGAIGAALMVPLRRGGLLVAVLILPFTVPVLIFGVAAAGAETSQPMLLLCALSLAATVLGPAAGAAALAAALD